MKYLKSYEKFFNFDKINFNEVENYNEQDMFYEFVDYYYDTLLTENDKLIIESYTKQDLSSYLIKEDFFDKFKTRFDKATTVIKNFPETATKALKSVVDAAKDSADFVKKLVSKLIENIKTMFSSSVDKLKAKLIKDKEFVSKLKEHGKDSFIKELKAFIDVSKFYKEKFIQILSKQLFSAFTKASTASDLPIEEKLNIINEAKMGKNVLSSLIHAIEKLPPFNWLHKVKGTIESGANHVVKGLSDFTQKMGGPAFVLPVTASLIAFFLEVKFKGLVKHEMLYSVGLKAIPGVYPLFTILSNVALVLAIMGAIDDIFQLGVLSHGHGGEHKQEQSAQTQSQAQPQAQPQAVPQAKPQAKPQTPEIKPQAT